MSVYFFIAWAIWSYLEMRNIEWLYQEEGRRQSLFSMLTMCAWMSFTMIYAIYLLTVVIHEHLF